VTLPAQRLLLDEIFSPAIAEQLRTRGHDVLALVADPELRALPDSEVLRTAIEQGRRLVTENVGDFGRLALEADGASVLFTSSRTFPRSRRRPQPLVDALDRWLLRAREVAPPAVAWLVRTAGQG